MSGQTKKTIKTDFLLQSRNKRSVRQEKSQIKCKTDINVKYGPENSRACVIRKVGTVDKQSQKLESIIKKL